MIQKLTIIARKIGNSVEYLGLCGVIIAIEKTSTISHGGRDTLLIAEPGKSEITCDIIYMKIKIVCL